MERRNWTREETILAFDLYCRVPFGKIHNTNQDIMELAKLIGRTPSAVAMKMCNLANYDPKLRERGIVGLVNGSKLESTVWEEFQNDWEAVAFESKSILANIKHEDISTIVNIDMKDIPLGEERDRVVKQRVGQYFFRLAVLNAYENCCCITGISVNLLLIASHIKPWKSSDMKTERTNPCNGLCLNALHDKAFDQGLITIDKKHKIIVSEKLKNEKIDNATKDWITRFEGEKIILPHRFLPEKQFIEYHNDVVFKH
jgi:putative restriction endonuclease